VSFVAFCVKIIAMGYPIIDVAPGLWVWQEDYAGWTPGNGWINPLNSTCVEADGEIVIVDPIAPADDASEAWARLDAHPPAVIAVLKPDHVRDVDRFAKRYQARAYGPYLFNRDDIPETDLEGIEPGTVLPGGLVTLYDGRGRNETPLWVPQHQTLIFADALTAPEGDLRIWSTPWHTERVLPALRALLDLPFQRVIVSHGKPVHDRTVFEKALRLSPWKE
jgi:glyoxylase-like metal-dependent hydrolase (beta-lactamase superfamily II)